ncbi:MAG: PASTA domain-containing protein, partial [Bacteroidota bacterium]
YRKFRPRKNLKHRASFAGYFPAEAPIYSCIVVITDPKAHGIYGSEVALPVFREIADKCFRSEVALQAAINDAPKPMYTKRKFPGPDAGNRTEIEFLLDKLNVPFEPSTNRSWSITQSENDTLHVYGRSLPEDQVPNITGMGLRDALYILENKGLTVVVEGAGKVVRQSLIPGTRIKGQTIKLTLR